MSLPLALLAVAGLAVPPAYLKVEAEDMAGVVEERDAAAPWVFRMPWYPQWNRGGDSGWWAVEGRATARVGEISTAAHVARGGRHWIWVRYEDWHGHDEPFEVVWRSGASEQRVEFGAGDRTPPDSPIGWAYAWDRRSLELPAGPGMLAVALTRSASVRRGVDALVVTDDPDWTPRERGFPPHAWARQLERDLARRDALAPLVTPAAFATVPSWALPQVAGRDFWLLGGSELRAGFGHPVRFQVFDGLDPYPAWLQRNAADPKRAPLFGSAAMGVQLPVGRAASLRQPGDPLREYLLRERRPFVLVANYGSAGQPGFPPEALRADFGPLFQGLVSGENSYLHGELLPPREASPLSRTRAYGWLFEEGGAAWRAAFEKDWGAPVANPFRHLALALSVGTQREVHRQAALGAELLAGESAAAMPYVPAQLAFVRGAARQHGRRWAWYYGASFGDAIRTFTRELPYAMSLDGLRVDERNATVGPSLAHIRRTLLWSWISGATFFFPEQGDNLFATDGALNPMGWSYDELARLAVRRPQRGVPWTPLAVVVDPAHGFETYDFSGSRTWDREPLSRAERSLPALLDVLFWPFPRNEGEPADDLGVPWPESPFGELADVVTLGSRFPAGYRVALLAGDVTPDAAQAAALRAFVTAGGTLVASVSQRGEIGADFFGVRLEAGPTDETHAVCALDGEELGGPAFPLRRAVPLAEAEVLARAPGGLPLAVRRRHGAGQAIVVLAEQLLGHDEAPVPYLPHLLVHLVRGLSPVDVRGAVQHRVNLHPRGYVVALANDGIVKRSHAAARLDPSARVEVTIALDERPLAVEDWLGDEPRDFRLENEWLAEWTAPRALSFQPEAGRHVARVRLAPGEVRFYLVRVR